MKTKKEKIALFDRLAASRQTWKKRNAYYYQALGKLLTFLVPPGRRVLELGCGTGELLASVSPSYGLGIDFSGEMITLARKSLSSENLQFLQEDAEQFVPDEPFDVIVLSDLLGESTDVWTLFSTIRSYALPSSRIIITTFNPFWEPVLRLGERIGLKMPQDHQNWLSMHDVENLLDLCDMEVVKSGRKLLYPWRIPLLSRFINRYLANLPLLNQLCLINYIVAKTKCPKPRMENPGVSIVIPCRNEYGNIENGIRRIPDMGSFTEVIYVDGNSNDGTVEEISRIMSKYGPEKNIRLIHQVPPGHEDGQGHGRMLRLGKGDAVRKGFAEARGDILMVLDADLTVMPEELPRFYEAIVSGKAEFINGTRLVYPMETEAMRTLNKVANKFFALVFSWLLGQRIKDTLCGTKALYASDYRDLVKNRGYFGDFDPFGDFDLLFGAAKLNLKIIDMPVHYAERTFGEIKIERFRHGLLLLKMSLFALFKLRFIH